MSKTFNLDRLDNQIFYLITAVGFILINIVFSNFSLRLDLSKGRAYTLSSSTLKILKKLNKPVEIKFFVSEDLPTRLIPLKNDVNEFLSEYKREGKNKITVKLIDPKKNDQALTEVKNLGIPELQFSQLENDKYAVSGAYFGISLSYDNKKEAIPQVTEINNLEYYLTSDILKMTRQEIVKIGVIGYGNSFGTGNDPLLSLKKILNDQFETVNIDVGGTEKKPIDPAVRTLMIFDNNQAKFTDDQIGEFKSYLDNNGKIVVFADGIWVGENLTTGEADHNLSGFLKDYGISLNKNLILSTNAEMVNFGNSFMQFLSPYPYWLKTNQFDQITGYFSNVNQLVFPWTSSVSLTKNGGWEAQALVKSTVKSWQKTSDFNFDPQKIANPKPSDIKQFDLAAISKNNHGGELLVIPSSRFVLEKFLGRDSSNLEFVFNTISNLSSGGALAGIRSREVSFYPLPDLSNVEKDVFKYANILLFPVLFGLYGALRIFRRNR